MITVQLRHGADAVVGQRRNAGDDGPSAGQRELHHGFGDGVGTGPGHDQGRCLVVVDRGRIHDHVLQGSQLEFGEFYLAVRSFFEPLQPRVKRFLD
jgi:hypothetical protein